MRALLPTTKVGTVDRNGACMSWFRSQEPLTRNGLGWTSQFTGLLSRSLACRHSEPVKVPVEKLAAITTKNSIRTSQYPSQTRWRAGAMRQRRYSPNAAA